MGNDDEEEMPKMLNKTAEVKEKKEISCENSPGFEERNKTSKVNDISAKKLKAFTNSGNAKSKAINKVKEQSIALKANNNKAQAKTLKHNKSNLQKDKSVKTIKQEKSASKISRSNSNNKAKQQTPKRSPRSHLLIEKPKHKTFEPLFKNDSEVRKSLNKFSTKDMKATITQSKVSTIESTYYNESQNSYTNLGKVQGKGINNSYESNNSTYNSNLEKNTINESQASSKRIKNNTITYKKRTRTENNNDSNKTQVSTKNTNVNKEANSNEPIYIRSGVVCKKNEEGNIIDKNNCLRKSREKYKKEK